MGMPGFGSSLARRPIFKRRAEASPLKLEHDEAEIMNSDVS
jgi:hypothetical protein